MLNYKVGFDLPNVSSFQSSGYLEFLRFFSSYFVSGSLDKPVLGA